MSLVLQQLLPHVAADTQAHVARMTFRGHSLIRESMLGQENQFGNGLFLQDGNYLQLPQLMSSARS